MATIHPYKGYLNTEFRLYANGTEDIPYSVFPENSESGTPVLLGVLSPHIPHSIRLKDPGNYKVVFRDGSSSNIIVEDGYRFGGGAYKNSYIFDETPWCMVVMRDRTYFYNRDSQESYVETISPDVIKVISSDYVLFENSGQDERTIYSLIDQKPILNVSNIVYSNDTVIVWKEVDKNDTTLKIYSLKGRCVQKTIAVDKYIIDMDANSIIYIIDNSLNKQDLALPLKENMIYCICGQLTSLVAPNIAISIEESFNCSWICIFDAREDIMLTRLRVEDVIASINMDALIDTKAYIDAINGFDISQIGCKNARIGVTFNTFMFYPTKWDIYCIIKKRTYERGKNRSNNTIIYKIQSLSDGIEYVFENDVNKTTIRDEIICFSNYRESLIFGRKIFPKYSKNISTYTHNQDVLLLSDESIYTLDEYSGWKPLGNSRYSFRLFNEFGIIKNEDSGTYFDLKGNVFTGSMGLFYKPYRYLSISGKIILHTGDVLPNIYTSISKSGEFGLVKKENDIFLLKFDNNNIVINKNILTDLYDSKSYKSVILSEDGSKIMYRDNNQTIILDVGSGNADIYDNVSYVEDVNGTRPQFSCRSGSLQPRLVNPVTGQFLSAERMLDYQFTSPNGLLYADTMIDKYVETWNLIANKILSDDEFELLYRNLHYIIDSNNEKDRINKHKRQLYIERNLFFFRKKYEEYSQEQKSDKELIEYLLRLDFLKFSSYFIEKRGVAYIRDKGNDSVVAKIALGSPLWHLNYVSFSYDNRYVAIAGRYPNDSNYGGLFLVYDLIKRKNIIVKRNSWAVWVAAFNRNNQVAAYSGEPILYDANISTNENEIPVNSYRDYSFLTFSPDGELIALSNQGYISKYDRYGNERKEWGHMPSCEVYVVRSHKIDVPLLDFSDLSDSGIDGLSDKEHNCPKSVSSVSFSNDNKRLMMVGKDGVVVIRNLHLEENAG